MSTSSIKTTVLQLGELHVRLLEAGRQGTPEILLIHGGLGDAHLHWHKTLAALGESFHVYAPDLPGFHDGSDALKEPSIPHLTRWINDLLRDLNVEKVFLIGTSVGALLARFYAAHYPAAVERLVLVDGGEITNLPGIVRTLINAPGISHAFYGYMHRHIYSCTALQRAIYQHDLLTEHFFQTLTRASIGYMSVFRSMLAEPWPVQQAPMCPTLIVWGQEDRLASPHEGRKLLREIPQAEYEIERIFTGYVSQPVTLSSTQNIRAHWGKLKIDGITVEILGAIQNNLGGRLGEWSHPVDVEPYRQIIQVEHMSLPVLSLKYMYHIYVTLGRREKAEMLKEWISRNMGISSHPQ